MTLGFLVGCTSSDSGELKQAKSDLRFTSEQLETCQNQLSVYRSGNTSDSSNSQEETSSEPAEPEYETVEAAEIKVDNKTVVCYDREMEACGMTFSSCKDNYVYRCMKDVKYKIIEEQKLIE